jgi:hypothetical protein
MLPNCTSHTEQMQVTLGFTLALAIELQLLRPHPVGWRNLEENSSALICLLLEFTEVYRIRLAEATRSAKNAPITATSAKNTVTYVPV